MNRVILITGGSRGIGYVTAKEFLLNGDKVIFCSPNEKSVKKAEGGLSEFGDVRGYTCDVSDWNNVTAFAQKIREDYKKIDVLINNAGVLWSGQFVEEPVEEIDKQVDVNLKGVLYMTRAFADLLGGNGVVLNVASGAGKKGHPGISTYSATKFGVVGFTESLAGEFQDGGLRVYGICPGPVDTDMLQEVGEGVRGAPPKEIADHILEIAGDNPPIGPGQCLDV